MAEHKLLLFHCFQIICMIYEHLVKNKGLSKYLENAWLQFLKTKKLNMLEQCFYF